MTKKILIFTATEGHLSQAKAIKQVLDEEKITTKILDLPQQANFKLFYFYTPFYRYFPSLFQIPYKIGKKEAILKAAQKIAKKWLGKQAQKAIKSFKPDMIISTYLFYNPAILKTINQQKIHIPFLNVISNPWTIHPLELSSTADFNVVYDEKATKISRELSIPQEKILAFGWFTRKEFFRKYDLRRLRKKFGFKKNIFTLLICGGSEGTNMVLKIIPALIQIKKPLQVLVVCGTNKTLYKILLSSKTLLRNFHFPANTPANGLTPQRKMTKFNLKVFKFTDNLSQLMAISDLVIGKAGPNLIFETAARQKPFFGVCHISGQEDGNLDLIRKKGLGLVEENPLKAAKLLKIIINKPQTLNRFKTTLKKEHDLNLQAAKKLRKLVRKMLMV